jgi:hypothetical protein
MKMSKFYIPRAGSNQDCYLVVENDVVTAHVVIDGHGGQVGQGICTCVHPLFFQIFLNPLCMAIETRIKELLSLDWVQTHSDLKEVAEEVKAGLLHTIAGTMDGIYRKRMDADPLFAKVHCGATCTIVLSRGEERVAIWIGDSPVYSLESGKLLTPANGYPENALAVFPRNDPRIAFRAYSPTGKVAHFTGMVAVQHSGIGPELLLLNDGVSADTYLEVLWDLWKLYPWQVSEVFTGPFILASDGIDYLLPREAISDDARLPLLMGIATNPGKAARDKYGARSPSDDLTIVVVGVEQEPAPPVEQESVRDSPPEEEEEFMLIPET